jgi:hypothetical protein
LRRSLQKGITEVLLGVVGSLEASMVPVLGPKRTGPLAALCSKNGLLLVVGGTNHTSTTIGTSDESAVLIAAAGPLFFLDLSVGNSQLALSSLISGRVTVQVLTVILGERTVTNASARWEMKFVLILVDDGCLTA